MLKLITKPILNLLFPKLCVGCKKSGTLLCDACWPNLHFVYTQICPVCHGSSIAGRTHAGCQTPQAIDGLISLTYYRGPVKSLVRQLKYRNATVIQELIGQLVEQYLKHEALQLPPGIVVPVPLHPSNYSERGFNQAEIIASVLAHKLQLPVVNSILSRSTKTTSQTHLSKEQRQTNVRGAFCLSTKESVKGATFILVDDVFTTGSTLKECAKVLKRAGAKQVVGFTLAQEG